MPELQVCSVINSIIAAFGTGMDICKKMALKKKRKYSKPNRTEETELQLRTSLSKRPQEIKVSYDQSVAVYGEHFRGGDTQAHSSLAQILLAMNAGLVEILNQSLSGDNRARVASRQSLLNLSEFAAADTLKTLIELNGRLKAASQLSLMVIPNSQTKDVRRRKAGVHHSDKERKISEERPAINPLLERGGWVRSKSGSTVVLAASAKRKAQRTTHQKNPSASLPDLSTQKSGDSAVVDRQKERKSPEHACSCLKTSPSQGKSPLPIKSNHAPQIHSQQQPPSMLIVPADYFEEYKTEAYQPPPRPPKIPLHSRPNPSTRARPISTATFMTGSTKLGEIPEHLWPDRFLSQEEQARIPVPYVIPPPLLEEPKKKRRGFRLWKRQPIAAY